MQLVHSSLPSDPHNPIPDFSIGTLGALASEFLTWLARQMDQLDHFLALLTHIAGLGCAVLTLLLLAHRWKHRRRLHLPPVEPPDIEDDLPMR